jgi:predicted RNase H-like nuclease
MEVTIIGVDCATNPTRVGLALGAWRNETASILEVKAGCHKEPIAKTIAGWISDRTPTLVAMDAPLGWPVPMGQVLVQHAAGEGLGVDAHDLSRRRTDRVE